MNDYMITHLQCDEGSPAVPLARVLAAPSCTDHLLGDHAGDVLGVGGAGSVVPEESNVE